MTKLHWSWSRLMLYTGHQNEGPLPHDARRVPLVLFIALVPILGAAFVVFLPVAGFVMVVWAGVSRLLKGRTT